MNSELARNSWGLVFHHAKDGILELRWLPGKMTDGAFKATLALLALEAEKVRPTGLLVDASKLSHRPGPGVMQWRDDCVVPRYGSAGVKKMAFQAPAGFPDTIEAGGKPGLEEPAIFSTAWFSERQHAIDWLRES